MSITNYVLAFAELLEKGALIAKEDPTQNVGLKAADHPMHVILANILRKTLNSNVMASIADDFHAAFNVVSNERDSLYNKLNDLLEKYEPTTSVAAALTADAPVAEAAPVEGEVVPAETEEAK